MLNATTPCPECRGTTEHDARCYHGRLDQHEQRTAPVDPIGELVAAVHGCVPLTTASTGFAAACERIDAAMVAVLASGYTSSSRTYELQALDVLEQLVLKADHVERTAYQQHPFFELMTVARGLLILIGRYREGAAQITATLDELVEQLAPDSPGLDVLVESQS